MADIIFIYHEDSSVSIYRTYDIQERSGQEQIKSAVWLWTALVVATVCRKEHCRHYYMHIINLQTMKM